MSNINVRGLIRLFGTVMQVVGYSMFVLGFLAKVDYQAVATLIVVGNFMEGVTRIGK